VCARPVAGRRQRPAACRHFQGAVSALPLAADRQRPDACDGLDAALRVPVPPASCCAAITSVSAACEQRPFFFDRGHFQAVTGLTSHRVYTASGSDLATFLSLWLWFCGTADPVTPYGSFRTQPELATWPPIPLLSV